MKLSYLPKNLKLRVLPYSLWLAYDIKNFNYINSLLPTNTELANIKLLQNDVLASPKLMFNAYTLESQVMNGMRLEVVSIVKNKDTNNHHFVMFDCFTNTMDWNPIDGIKLFANAKCNFKYENDIYKLSIKNKKNEILSIMGKKDKLFKPQTKFVVDANKECYYRNIPLKFPMKFERNEVTRRVRSLDFFNVTNILWENTKGNLTHIFLHEYDMTFTVF